MREREHQKELQNPTANRTVLKLAIPAIVENLSQVFLGLGDTYFVSLVGTAAIAAVGLTNLYMNLFLAVITAFTVGTVAMVSKAIGSRNKQGARQATYDSLVGALIASGLFAVCIWIFGERLMALAGAEASVIEAGSWYFRIIALSAIFAGTNMVMASSLRATGDTGHPMIAGVTMNVVNLALDWLFVVVLDMGIVGAGSATAIARFGGLAYVFFMYTRKMGRLKGVRFDTVTARELFSIGVPAGIEKLIMRTGQLFYGALIVKIGTEAYAAHNIAGAVEALSYLPGMGFGVAAATLVGQSLGSEEPEKGKKAGWTAWRLSTVFMVTIAALFALSAPLWAAAFTDDPAIQSDVIRVIRLIALFQPFLCATMVTAAALQGAGDTKYPMVLTLFGIWGIRVLGVYVLGIQLQMGLFGVWVAYALDITVRGSLLMLRFHRGKWATVRATMKQSRKVGEL